MRTIGPLWRSFSVGNPTDAQSIRLQKYEVVSQLLGLWSSCSRVHSQIPFSCFRKDCSLSSYHYSIKASVRRHVRRHVTQWRVFLTAGMRSCGPHFPLMRIPLLWWSVVMSCSVTVSVSSGFSMTMFTSAFSMTMFRRAKFVVIFRRVHLKLFECRLRTGAKRSLSEKCGRSRRQHTFCSSGVPEFRCSEVQVGRNKVKPSYGAAPGVRRGGGGERRGRGVRATSGFERTSVSSPASEFSFRANGTEVVLAERCLNPTLDAELLRCVHGFSILALSVLFDFHSASLFKSGPRRGTIAVCPWFFDFAVFGVARFSGCILV